MSDPVTLDPDDLDGDPALALWSMENEARTGTQSRSPHIPLRPVLD